MLAVPSEQAHSYKDQLDANNRTRHGHVESIAVVIICQHELSEDDTTVNDNSLPRHVVAVLTA